MINNYYYALDFLFADKRWGEVDNIKAESRAAIAGENIIYPCKGIGVLAG